MLWLAWVPYILGINMGGFIVGTSVAWMKAFPVISGKSMCAAIVLVLGLFTNIIFWMTAVTRKSQPVATSWKVLILASLANNVVVLFFFPIFAQNAGYWFWLIAFAIAAWALLFLAPDQPMPTAPVPSILWVWIGFTLFWLFVTVMNWKSPSPATTVVMKPPQATSSSPPEKVAGSGRAKSSTTQPLALTSYVSDFANLLQPGDRNALTTMLSEFEKKTSDQIGVAIYAHCPSESIEDFTIHAAEASRFGRKGLDNGAVLFVFVAERVARIEVGYGLEGALPDADSRRILDAQLAPHFARGEYEEGIAGTLSAMCEAVEREYGTTHKANYLTLLWPQFKIAVSKTVLHAWPLARDAPLEARIGISFFGSLLGLGVWDGLGNAGRILWDLVLGIRNLIRRRRFRAGMLPFRFESIYDTLKLMVIFACIAGTYVLVAGGGSFGGAGALIHWIAAAG